MGKNYSPEKPGITPYHMKIGLVDKEELQIAVGIQGLGEPLKGRVKEPGNIDFVYGKNPDKAVFALKTVNKNGTKTRIFTLLMPEEDIASMMCGKEGEITDESIRKTNLLIERAKTFVEKNGITYVAQTGYRES